MTDDVTCIHHGCDVTGDYAQWNRQHMLPISKANKLFVTNKDRNNPPIWKSGNGSHELFYIICHNCNYSAFVHDMQFPHWDQWSYDLLQEK